MGVYELSDLQFSSWTIISPPEPLRPAQLCSVSFEPSPPFRDAAQEYRAAHPVVTAPRTAERKAIPAPTIAINASPAVEAARARLRAAHREAFDDGFRVGALGFADNDRTRLPGGYPRAWPEWSPAARDAWFAGNYAGLQRARRLREAA
jgi:hypothetical protein